MIGWMVGENEGWGNKGKWRPEAYCLEESTEILDDTDIKEGIRG